MGRKRAASQTALAIAHGDYVDLTLDDEQPTPKPKRRRTKQPTSAASPSDSGPSAPSTTSRKGRGSSKKQVDAQEEQRTSPAGTKVRYVPSPSVPVQERIARALPGSGHRLFLIDTKPTAPMGSPGGPAQEFHVLGTTGNVYTVTVGQHPHCTCPDFGRCQACKHTLFVFLRVLGLQRDNPIIWQRALTRREVEEALGHVANTADQSVLASERVRQRYAQLTGGAPPAPSPDSKRRPIEGDCPICYDEMSATGEATVFCQACGNNMHASCFKRWAASKRSSGGRVTCVYCRANWPDAGGSRNDQSAAAGLDESGRYLNLADVQGAPPPSLEDLYGDNALWIHASQGSLSRRNAARLFYASRNWS